MRYCGRAQDNNAQATVLFIWFVWFFWLAKLPDEPNQLNKQGADVAKQAYRG